MARPEKIRLGEVLMQQKLLSEEQLTQALADQKRTGRKLGRVFVENGFVTEEQIANALAKNATRYAQVRDQETAPVVAAVWRSGLSIMKSWRMPL